jgi:hypothetical protein
LVFCIKKNLATQAPTVVGIVSALCSSLCFQFNFVGKLLGPKGNSMKRLQEETMTKMAVLGKGSMRDKQKVSSNFIREPILRLQNLQLQRQRCSM